MENKNISSDNFSQVSLNSGKPEFALTSTPIEHSSIGLTVPLRSSLRESLSLCDEFSQVPVINKTKSLFKRDINNPKKILDELDDEMKELMAEKKYIFTVKTDGTCGLIISVEPERFTLMRRQDIKINSRNYKMVMENGCIKEVAGEKCFFTKMVRGSGKNEIICPLYIFQLGHDLCPELENDTHIIGFTPLLKNFGDDKYAITAIEGDNGEKGMKIYTTLFNGSLDIPVKLCAVEEIMCNSLLKTVEIMGSKISNKYGFTSDRHIINPHGSIIYPNEINKMPLNYESIRNWFENDKNNRWADVEGFVIHFPEINKRFKVHRGHVGLEHKWQTKKESGIKFKMH